MKFRIVNIVDTLEKINTGVWHAALGTSNALKQHHEVESHVVAPKIQWNDNSGSLAGIHFIESTDFSSFERLIAENGWRQEDTIVATHGCWQFPTAWGETAEKKGFRWVFCPHGMLEPWPLSQKRLRKKLFFWLREQPKVKKCSAIRASSRPEKENLQQMFPRNRVVLVPNGIIAPEESTRSPDDQPIRILYLGRLHKKKCPLELTKAFVSSSLANNSAFELVVAGPDQGEREAIENSVKESQVSNVIVLDAQFGEAKTKLLCSSDYFALVSHSEGFSSALIEAMAYECVPIISDGANFPEACEAGVAVHTETNVTAIRKSLDLLNQIDKSELRKQQQASRAFVIENYTRRRIAERQYDLAVELLDLATK